MLAPMNPAEFASFAEEAVASYAHDNMISGRASQADAQRLARQSFGRLLPDGLNTPGHHLFTIRADSAGSAGSVVGSLWFAVVDGVEGRTGYIYNIRSERGARSGRGGGTAARAGCDRAARVRLQHQRAGAVSLAGLRHHRHEHAQSASPGFQRKLMVRR
jgi:hypothetical protein